MSSSSSRRVGRTTDLEKVSAPRRKLPSVRRPSARAPGENELPAARMPTNAAAHRTTATSAAASGSQSRLTLPPDGSAARQRLRRDRDQGALAAQRLHAKHGGDRGIGAEVGRSGANAPIATVLGVQSL